MYCYYCGVKLGQGMAQCPVCGTAVPVPVEAAALFPKDRRPAPVGRSAWPQVVFTVLFVIAAVVVLLCDLQTEGLGWSGIVLGGLVTAYVALVLPLWFSRPNPVIFVPCSFLAAGVYLLYLDVCVGNGWFLPFALPVTGGFCLICTALAALLRYVKKGKLFTLGGALILTGGHILLLEGLMVWTFSKPFRGWSIYPMGALVLLGGVLIFLGICRPARCYLERKLFV